MGALPKDERRAMQHRERGDEPREEHVQTFVQEDRRDGIRFDRRGDAGRLQQR